MNSRPGLVVAYHKAELVHHGQQLLVSQRCRSFRPECQIRLDGKKVGVAYFGMGTAASHPSAYNFVCFCQTMSVLLAADRVVRQYREFDRRRDA